MSNSNVPKRGNAEAWDLAKAGMELAADAEMKAGDWSERAFACVVDLAHAGGVFNADDVYERVDRPHRPCAVGAVFLRALRAGIIVPVGWRTSVGKQRHAAPSRLYVGARFASESEVA